MNPTEILDTRAAAETAINDLTESPWLAAQFVSVSVRGNKRLCPVARYLNARVPVRYAWSVTGTGAQVAHNWTTYVSLRFPPKIKRLIENFDRTGKWPSPPGFFRRHLRAIRKGTR